MGQPTAVLILRVRRCRVRRPPKSLRRRLVAFRRQRGRVGLVDQARPHRGALHGVRSATRRQSAASTNGWKFDDKCARRPLAELRQRHDQPHDHQVLSQCERNGVLWTYMGPKRETSPPLPESLNGTRPSRTPSSTSGWQEATLQAHLEGESTLRMCRAISGGQLNGGIDRAVWQGQDLSPVRGPAASMLGIRRWRRKGRH